MTQLALALFLRIFPGSSPHEWSVLSTGGRHGPTARRCHMEWEDAEPRCSDYRLSLSTGPSAAGLVCRVDTREDQRFSWVQLMTYHEPRCPAPTE